MKLGIAGPILTSPFRDHLYPGTLDRPFLPRGLGGIPVVHLALALLERGWQLTIFTLDPEVSKEVVLEGPRLKICVGPYRPRHRARDFFGVERRYLREAIRREAPHLVHAHWTYEFALGALESGVPTVVTAHDAPVRGLLFDSSPYRIMRLLMASKVARLARSITAVSPYVARHFERVLRHPNPIRVIPNGLPSTVFVLGGERQPPASETVTFATVLNGWGKLKNGKAALEAFARVRAAAPNVRLLMFGDDYGEGQKAAAWARDRHFIPGVEFFGPLPYAELLARLAREVDVLVHPSLHESFSLAIAEAMALGVPVIGGIRSGGVPFTLDEGRAGLLVDVVSPKRLADAMLRLVGDPNLRLQVGCNGRESALRRFRIEDVAAAYENGYQDLARAAI